MSPEDIATYRANYDLAAWERITNGWRLHVAPPGAILAINALCDEVERLRDDAERWRSTSACKTKSWDHCVSGSRN